MKNLKTKLINLSTFLIVYSGILSYYSCNEISYEDNIKFNLLNEFDSAKYYMYVFNFEIDEKYQSPVGELKNNIVSNEIVLCDRYLSDDEHTYYFKVLIDTIPYGKVMVSQGRFSGVSFKGERIIPILNGYASMNFSKYEEHEFRIACEKRFKYFLIKNQSNIKLNSWLKSSINKE